MAERDPYAECVCTHGRHTHVRYTGACGLCDCAVVRPAPIPESGDPSSAHNEQEQAWADIEAHESIVHESEGQGA